MSFLTLFVSLLVPVITILTVLAVIILSKMFIFTNEWRIKKIIVKNTGEVKYIPQCKLVCNKFWFEMTHWQNFGYSNYFDTIPEVKQYIIKEKEKHIDVRYSTEEIINV